MEDINCWESKFEACYYSNRLLNKIDLLNQQVNNKVDAIEVKKAIYYAKKYHGYQMRQSGEPYYSHPLEVAYMLINYTIDEATQYYRTDLLVTSILHDTIEDTKLTEEMILGIFGRTIATQVESLTRVKSYGKISSAEIIRLLWIQKKPDILLIKLFDRLHNIQTIGAKSPEKIKKILDETFYRFLSLSLYLKVSKFEQVLSQLCTNIPEVKHDKIFQLRSLLSEDNSLLPSLTSQNKISQIHNLLS